MRCPPFDGVSGCFCVSSPACVGSDRSQLSAVRRVLEREAHSPFYQEGVSYALLKVTELGLVPAAEILLEFGADLSFEGENGGKGPGQGEPAGEKLPWEVVIAGAEREGAASPDLCSVLG